MQTPLQDNTRERGATDRGAGGRSRAVGGEDAAVGVSLREAQPHAQGDQRAGSERRETLLGNAAGQRVELEEQRGSYLGHRGRREREREVCERQESKARAERRPEGWRRARDRGFRHPRGIGLDH
eukprot:107137-Rhodomonas_salina.2